RIEGDGLDHRDELDPLARFDQLARQLPGDDRAVAMAAEPERPAHAGRGEEAAVLRRHLLDRAGDRVGVAAMGMEIVEGVFGSELHRELTRIKAAAPEIAVDENERRLA